jgi:hypothetical protein
VARELSNSQSYQKSLVNFERRGRKAFTSDPFQRLEKAAAKGVGGYI